jgi:hypothetical protein
VAVLLLQDSGESSSLSYIAVALETNQGYKGTNAILIGNHVASQKVEVSSHTIVVNYADRYPWQGLAVRPSVSRSRFFFVENRKLEEKPFAKLTSDTAMKLAMRDWEGCRHSSIGRLRVNVMDGKGGTWYVEALCDELKDHSLSAERRIAQAQYKDGVWSLGDVLLHEYRCRPNHGREDFSVEKCQ